MEADIRQIAKEAAIPVSQRTVTLVDDHDIGTRDDPFAGKAMPRHPLQVDADPGYEPGEFLVDEGNPSDRHP